MKTVTDRLLGVVERLVNVELLLTSEPYAPGSLSGVVVPLLMSEELRSGNVETRCLRKIVDVKLPHRRLPSAEAQPPGAGPFAHRHADGALSRLFAGRGELPRAGSRAVVFDGRPDSAGRHPLCAVGMVEN